MYEDFLHEELAKLYNSFGKDVVEAAIIDVRTDIAYKEIKEALKSNCKGGNI